MEVYLSGVHGVGKTTAIKNTHLLVKKFYDIDIVKESNIYEMQKSRLNKMERLLIENEDLDNLLFDRSPLDFIIYNDWHFKNNYKDRNRIQELTEDLIDNWKEREPVNILVYDDKNYIWKRIIKRNRTMYDEIDPEYFSFCYDQFYDNNGEYFEAITGYKSEMMHIDYLPNYLTKLFGDSKV